MKKICFFFSVLLLSFFSVYGQVINIKIANIAPERSPWDIELKKMAQEWNKITNGKVRLTFINAVTLGDETGVIKKITSVRPGQKSPLQGGVFSPPGIHSLAPDAGIYTLSVPFLIRSQEELDLVLDKFGGKIKDAIRKAGYEVITWSNVGWLSFYTTSPVNSLADLKKLRIASAGLDNNVLHQAFAACGFRTMSVMSDKLAQSLQSRDGVQGFYSVPMYAYAMGFTKYITDVIDAKICPVVAALLISNDTWNSVPEEFKPALLESVENTKERLNASLEQSDRTYLQNMEKEGVRLKKLDAEELAVWAGDFQKDVEALTKSVDVFDVELLNEINQYLTEYRKSR